MTMTFTEAEELVDRYLTLFMEGRLDEAQDCGAGGTADLPRWRRADVAARRAAEVGRLYESVAKTIDRTWSAKLGDDIVVTTTAPPRHQPHVRGVPGRALHRLLHRARRKDRGSGGINDAAQVGVVAPYSRSQNR